MKETKPKQLVSKKIALCCFLKESSVMVSSLITLKKKNSAYLVLTESQDKGQ